MDSIKKRLSYLGAAPICNKNAERGIFVLGFCLPFCTRCSALFVGYLLSITLILFSFIHYSNNPFTLIFLIPMTIDGLFQKYTNYVSTNLIRILTGLLFGYFLVINNKIMDDIIHSIITIIK